MGIQWEKDYVSDMFKEVYNDHPLMANVSIKAHEFFKDTGLDPNYTTIDSLYSNTRMRVDYIDQEKRKTTDNENDRDIKPVKSTLFKSNSLIIILPNLLMLNIHCDQDIRHQVGLTLKEIGGPNSQQGTIEETRMGNNHLQGHFDENSLKYFLNGCLQGQFLQMIG